MKKSILSRSIELGKMGLKLGLKELKSSSPSSRLDQAKILVESLSHLKGAAQKAGQILSLELDDYFPSEAVEILSQLQNQASIIPFESIDAILQSELGPEKYQTLWNIDKSPLATASISQVHAANYADQKVALKVQHEGIADSIDADLAVLKNIIASYLFVAQKAIPLDAVFLEFRNLLQQETDFLNEVRYIQLFQEKIKTLGSDQKYYHVPNVFEEMSTSKLLTLTFEPGLTLTEWIKTNPSMDKRVNLSHLMLNLFCYEFFQWQMVQTDPNFSNFLIREDQNGELHLVLLDFGATRTYTKTFISDYQNLLREVAAKNETGIFAVAQHMGLLDQRENQEASKLFLEMMYLAVEPFFQIENSDDNTKGQFRFSDIDYNTRSKEVIGQFLKELKWTPPPHQLMFLHRKLGGIFALLKRLNVQMDVSNYWFKIIKNESSNDLV